MVQAQARLEACSQSGRSHRNVGNATSPRESQKDDNEARTSLIAPKNGQSYGSDRSDNIRLGDFGFDFIDRNS